MIRLLGDQCMGDVAMLRFSGEIDEYSVSSLRAMLRGKAAVKCPVLLLEFSLVTFVNSSGMAALIEYWRAARGFGGYFAVVGLNRSLLEIFHIVHLDDNMWLFPSVESAMQAIGEITDEDMADLPEQSAAPSRKQSVMIPVGEGTGQRVPDTSLSQYP